MNIQPTVTTGQTRTDERAITAASAARATNTTGTATKTTADGVAPSSDEVKAAVKSLNDKLGNSAQDIEFSVDQDSKETVVKLVDRTTHEVLRQMPTKEALEIAKSIDKAMGKLIDSQA